MSYYTKTFFCLVFKRNFSIFIICLLAFTACGDSVSTGDGVCNHDWGAWIETTAPTCTEDGVETRTCILNNAHKETQPGAAALGHDWNMISGTAPTCSEPGYGTGTCKRTDCGETVTDAVIPVDPKRI